MWFVHYFLLRQLFTSCRFKFGSETWLWTEMASCVSQISSVSPSMQIFALHLSFVQRHVTIIPCFWIRGAYWHHHPQAINLCIFRYSQNAYPFLLRKQNIATARLKYTNNYIKDVQEQGTQHNVSRETNNRI